jgi:hypothetical protein
VTTTYSRTSASSSSGGAGDTWAERLARFGLLGKGVLHAVVGLLALQLAVSGSSSSEASSGGALRWIADQPLGVPALWLVGFSLLALAAWRAITTFTGDPVEDDDGWYRGVWAAKAFAYGGFAFTFLKAAMDGGSSSASSDDQQASQATSTVFDWPMGRWIVVLAGLAVVGVAVYLVFTHALGADFADRLSVSKDSSAVTLGRIGYGLRSLAYMLVGALLVQAGLAGQEQRAEGLSGALESTSDEWWGTALLVAVGVGFIAYGAYCFAEAKLRRSA